MIASMGEGVSPPRPASRIQVGSDSSLLHLTCHELSLLRIVYDDIRYGSHCVTKVMLCVQITAYRDEQTPQNKRVRVLRVRDSTGTLLSSLQVFENNEHFSDLDECVRSGHYFLICADAKCSGTFKLDMKFNAFSISRVTNMNQITGHLVQVIKDKLLIANH